MCLRCRIPGHASTLGADPFAATVDAYVHNLLAATAFLRRRARGYLSVESMHLLVALAESGDVRAPEGGWKDDTIRARLDEVIAASPGVREVPAPEAPAGPAIELIASLAGLSALERRILTLFIALKSGDELAEVVRAIGDVSLSGAAQLVAAMIVASPEEVGRAFAPKAQLFATGLLRPTLEATDLADRFALKSGIVDLVSTPSLGREDVIARFLPPAPEPTLAWSDFPRGEREIALAREILASAIAQRRRGVNLLLYGPSGTGKTELARLLAKEVGASLYVAGHDEETLAPTATERLAALRLGSQLLAATRSLLLFDEIEDIFDWKHGLDARAEVCVSKIWFNDALESNLVPTIWITNQVGGIDPAFLRRFCYAVEMRPGGARERARVLARHLGPQTSGVDVDAIARRWESSPARIGTAVAIARMLGSVDRPTIEGVLAPVEKLVRGPERACAPFDPATFRVDVLNADADLRALADQLSTWTPDGKPGISMCFWGPPGTGKSELAKWLAWRMGRRVVMRRASDIHSKWVGETERNIADAFQEARDEDALLLFDEADSFLRDRTGAQASWEVTFVNEFLQQLEAYEGVVVCTTNLWRDLDAAALRRFVLKIELRPMTALQAATLYEATFGEPAPEAVLGRMTLTPGDFAAAARRRRLAGGAPLELLAAEVKAKRQAPRSIGF